MTQREYLGDGVYAQFDGYQVWISVEGGSEAPAFVALEPNVFNALVEYGKRQYKDIP